jgi:hypothetical protein
VLAARLLGAAMQRGGRGGVGLGACGGDVFGARPATREQVARPGLGEAGLGGGDPRLREPVVEPREHLAGVDRVAFVDGDLGDPALGLEREQDRIVERLDPAGRDQHAGPRDDRLGVDRRGLVTEPQPAGAGEGSCEEEVAKLHG